MCTFNTAPMQTTCLSTAMQAGLRNLRGPQIARWQAIGFGLIGVCSPASAGGIAAAALVPVFHQLFVTLLVIATALLFPAVTKWPESRKTMNWLILLFIVCQPIYFWYQYEKSGPRLDLIQPRDKHGYVFSSEEARRASTSEPLYRALCAQNTVRTYPASKARGVRILEVKAIEGVSARGWDSGLAFFLGGFNPPYGSAEPATVVDAFKHAVQKIEHARRDSAKPISPFLEYQGEDGRWMRYAKEVGASNFSDQEVLKAEAAYGLRLYQRLTGLEKSHTIFSAKIEIVDVSNKKLVGEHISYTRDLHWGAHNSFALLRTSHCDGEIDGDLASALLSLIF